MLWYKHCSSKTNNMSEVFVSIPQHTRVSVAVPVSNHVSGYRDGVLYDANFKVGKCINIFLDGDPKPISFGVVKKIEKDKKYPDPNARKYVITYQEAGKEEEKVEVLVPIKGITYRKMKHRAKEKLRKKNKTVV